jgi:trans-aconitate 2-methyltransferase
MPRNFEAPSHRLLLETAAEGPWAADLAGVLDHRTVLMPVDYARLLRPAAVQVDIWETEYLHVLDGDDPVLDWVSGTALLPVTSRLPADQAAAFRAAYGARLRAAYPRETDGPTLFPFRRLFIIARI